MLARRQNDITTAEVCTIASRILTILKKVHKIGKVYNDLKLDNILVGSTKTIQPQSKEQSSLLEDEDLFEQIWLIDFGLCTDYLDALGNHVKEGQTEEFVGNLAMSSGNAMSFRVLSRRDDLISLSYLMIYIKNGHLDFLDCIDNNTKFSSKLFQKVSNLKKQMTPSSLCPANSPTAPFLPFVDYVHSLKFDQKPDYEMLLEMLKKIREEEKESGWEDQSCQKTFLTHSSNRE